MSLFNQICRGGAPLSGVKVKEIEKYQWRGYIPADEVPKGEIVFLSSYNTDNFTNNVYIKTDEKEYGYHSSANEKGDYSFNVLSPANNFFTVNKDGSMNIDGFYGNYYENGHIIIGYIPN